MEESESLKSKYSDAVVALGVVGVLMLLITRLPPILMDMLLAMDFSMAIVVLLTTMYVKEPLLFSAYPSVILVSTLGRLSLNVASTRLILLDGYGGTVIEAFGSFVAGGDYVVGIVIFFIIMFVNVYVISHGAVRIGEVHARFTLDAMPGKQLSIDADLNNGLLTEAEAKKKRTKLEKEAEFFGAMDGASRFVDRDAQLNIVITMVNIVAGLLIGHFNMGLDWGDAAKRFTVMTIGDGLVSAIPSLMMSTATGMIVTRAGQETALGETLMNQLTVEPKALLVASFSTFVFGMVPGLPTMPFLVISSALGVLGYFSLKGKSEESEEDEASSEGAAANDEAPAEDSVEALLSVDQMELEIGYGLIPLVDTAQGGDLLDRVTMIRRQIAVDMGFIVPPIRIRDNMQLKPNDYQVKIKGMPVANGDIMMGYLMAMDPGFVTDPIAGVETVEPSFGLPALWVTASQREEAELRGYTIVEPSSIIATHLTEVIKTYAAEIITRQDVAKLLDNLKSRAPAVAEAMSTPDRLPVVQKVLQELLREKVSIRDLVTIAEVISDYVGKIADLDVLCELVRQGLRRVISNSLKSDDQKIYVLTLDPALERHVSDSIQRNDQGAHLSIDPNSARLLSQAISVQVANAGNLGYQPVILTSPGIRLYFKRLVTSTFPNITVVSYNEIVPNLTIENIGVISLQQAKTAA